ncbi:oligosaccharide flippase family protein [Paenibacillus sp. LHD-117]|uniref:oligosaccharide flippase family protein n=1 Tax=Paenibacillus sp. LHD-117 TaxID=3071412 RepID=UPI0027DFC0A4|nr:oligosaccharide flippase family protein [Paenibacillus sp. LHD-117]MDQ6420743.1 oligosaccharide flippase family protein [Paenibacillus sp. LHD-117]
MSGREPGGKPPRLWQNGVAMMAGAALLSKLIGALQKIPLQNVAGDRVFGIYNAVYPFYQMIAVLATAGLPTAVSIVIASRMSRVNGGFAETRTALLAAVLLLGTTGTAAAALMWMTADRTAAWIGDAAVAPVIWVLSLSLLLAPVAAALRGYMQGMRRMALSAVSQLAEQLVRVIVMLLALGTGLAAGWSDETLAAGVMFGAAAGAAVTLLLLGLGSRTMTGGAGGIWGVLSRGKLLREMKELAALALPAALAALVVPAVAAVDSFTVPALLRADGLSAEEAMSLFGVYGRGQPLVQLVAMAAGAGAAAMVPGLVRAKAERQLELLQSRLALMLRMAWLIGAAASVGLVLLAEPINVMLYRDASGTGALALIGCTALAGCVSAVAAPALQALGSARAPALLLLLAALLKGALNAALVPSLGIEGAALSGVVALTAAALLGAAALRHAAAGLRPPHARTWRAAGWRPAAAGIAALAVMAAALWLCERALAGGALEALPPRAAAAALALTCIAVGAAVFAAAVLRGGVIGAREWRALPGGETLAARLRRRGLIPRE